MKIAPKNLAIFCSVLAALSLTSVPTHAQQPVQVSTGYQDYANSLNSPEGGNNLWYGSPNTVYFGSSGAALSSDPDFDAVLLQNLGGSNVTLSSLSIGSGSYDLFSLDSVSGPVTLDPGTNYIFAGVDGSDLNFGPGVNLTVGGTLYNYLDTTNGTTPTDGNYVLNGYPGGDESVQWTPIYTPDFSSPVPDTASTLGLLAAVMAGLVALRRRLAQARAS
jgi:hypothetical protein